MDKILLAFKLARWHYFPVIVIPVVLGSLLAWYQGYPFSWIYFTLCFVGAFFAHLGANAANDVFDDLSGVDRIAHETIPENRGSTVCGSEILTRGLLSRREGFIVTATFFAIALGCGIPLMIRFGWPIAGMAILGFLIGVLYCARPVAFGYVGRGLGEIGIFIAFGILPVVGGYFVQAGAFDWRVLVASIPPGMFTVSVLYNHHFSHASADARVGKMSPVVVLGEKRARMISPILLAAGYLAIVINVLLGIYPIAALAGLLTAPFILRAFAKLDVPSSCEASLGFLFKVVKANAATGALLIGAIVLSTIL